MASDLKRLKRDVLAAASLIVASECQREFENYHKALERSNGDPHRTQKTGKVAYDCINNTVARIEKVCKGSLDDYEQCLFENAHQPSKCRQQQAALRECWADKGAVCFHP